MFILKLSKTQLESILDIKKHLNVEHLSINNKGELEIFVKDKMALPNTEPLIVELGHVSIHNKRHGSHTS